MNKIVLLLLIALLNPFTSFSKDKKGKKSEGYIFTPVYDIKTTSVKDQNHSGTCWSFATTSFIETEAIRLGKGELDLSEMYFVSTAYPEKAKRFVRYHGISTFTEGGQAHDVINIIRDYGIVPETVYSGLEYGEKNHEHNELVSMLTAMVNVVIKNKNSRLSTKWYQAVTATTDAYFGAVPEKFTYNEKEYTPKSFQNEITGINPDDYVEITSYNHYPFYSKFDLELPDNWSHDDYYNVPINDLMIIMENAFKNGFSVCWDGDVSERTFSHKKGVAVIPEKSYSDMNDDEKTAIWEKPGVEKEITQESRQKTFDNYKTTDDHLMHLTGVSTDQNGNNYYKTKNSWNTDSNDFGGYLHMSENYIKLKTVAIMVHKDAIPKDIREKLGL